MKIKQIKEFDQIEKQVMSMIFSDVRNTPDDNVWRKYERGFTFEQQNYVAECRFKIDNTYLSYKDLLVRREAEIIDVVRDARVN